MKTISRREAITGAIGAGASLLALGGSVDAQADGSPVAFAGKHVAKPLPFDPAKLTGISEKLIRSHHENNYMGAVKGLNAVERSLNVFGKEKDLPASLYGQLKREELIRTGSVVLHEKYFANLGGNGKPDGAAKKMIEHSFGSYENWVTEFKLTGNSLSGGSGWVIFSYNQHTKEFHNYWSADHTSNAPFSIPIIVLDMYEHAYQMDYGAAAAKYVDAFMLNINWDEVNRRVETLVLAKRS